jgi:predicted dehydrogenase
MAEKLRAIMAGCGSIAGAWLPHIMENVGVELVGMVDLNEETARSRKTEFKLERAVVGTDLDKFLDMLKPDVVFDLTVPEAHVSVTLAALSHGCHVLGEKPLADSMENARRMVRAAEEAGKIYAVIQNRRYNPYIRGYREMIASGRLGQLTTLYSDFFIGAHFGGFRDRMEHVLLLDMAIHTFDAARLISGTDPVAVYCREWNPGGSWYDHAASAVATFEMTDGVVYNYRGSWCAEGLNTSWESDWRAICQTGSCCWNGSETLKAQAVAESGGFFSKWADLEPGPSRDGRTGGHKGVIDEFVSCVLHGGTPETAASDNIKSLAMVFGAIESAETGRRVEIEV